MLPDRDGHVRIRANLDGEIELKAVIGQTIHPGQPLAIVEGDDQIETLSVRRSSVVVELMDVDGKEVPQGTCLMVVRELPT